MPPARAYTPRCLAARAFAQRLAPVVAELQAAGICSLQSIAQAMMKRRIPTPGGTKRWRAVTVTRLLRRLENDVKPPPGVPVLVTPRVRPSRRPPHIEAAVLGALQAFKVPPPAGFAAWNAAALDAAPKQRRHQRKRVTTAVAAGAGAGQD